jgi:adenosine deaminase
MNPTIPLVDLHLHLEGAVRLQTVIEISRQNHLNLPAWTVEGLQPYAWIEQPTADIMLLLPKFDLLRQVFVDLDACRRVTHEVVEDCAARGLGYAEIRFSPLFMAELHHLDPYAVTEAVCQGWEEASATSKMPFRLIVILSRTYGAEACQVEMECAMRYQERGVVGVDLAGDEARQPARHFAHLFDRIHSAGMKVTAHAGEFAGVDSVRETIELLKPDRLGHAVHAADDPRVLDLIRERGIAVECCPTSNVLTTSVPEMSRHPLPVFLRHGICATVNTDDPALMGDLNIRDEYRAASEIMGCSDAEIEQIQKNGWKAAFLEPDIKEAILHIPED